MRLIEEKMFAPIYTSEGDSITADFTYEDEIEGKKTVASITKQAGVEKFNCMRVYEIDDFDGMNNCVAVVIGYKEQPDGPKS